jgi:transposase InsO family protein
MSGMPSLTILSEEQKFNGDNLLQWNTNITQLLGSKGLSGYIDGKIKKPGPESISLPSETATAQTATVQPTTTPIYSATPTLDEWIFRDQLARGHITLNCTDIAGLGVVTTGTAKEAWDSIQTEWGRSTDMRRSHAQEALNKTTYVEGTDIQEHVKLLRTRRAAVDNLSTSVMSDETWRGIIIRSIPPTTKWLPVLPSLYALSSSADIVSTLFAHGMIIGRDTKASSGSSNTVLAARTTEGCTNPNCKAKKRSTHTTANCYWPGGGKEGQFPANFGQKNRANVVTSESQPEHFVLSAIIPNTTGQSGIVFDDPSSLSPTALISQGFQNFQNGKVPTFMDSGASDTMFVSRDAFTNYKSVAPRRGDSAKAENGSFEIVGEGNVVQRYEVDGKEKEVTYTRALHTPTLNANLVSVSALDKAGLTTTFGNGKGIARKADGTVVLTGRNVSGMYLLQAVDSSPNNNFAMISLSKPTSLEQWHRRLTHCSPLTIQEMARNGLVDGLIISESTINGKCEDCILGRQTRRPFDGETEKDLKVLDLVAFDLWGPSRVQSAGGKIYLMIIIDGGTSYKYGVYLSDKSDATTIPAFEIFRAKAETVTGRKVCRLRTDRAYESVAWEKYCQSHGITHEFTAPYSSAQNGLAERAIRTTIDDVRTLLRDSSLSHSYWAEAAAYSIDTRNLIPSRRHPGCIPTEAFSGKRQNISYLRVFGAKCWAKVPAAHGDSKLDPRSVECRLLGYALGSGNYKVQDVNSRRVFISCDMVFEEGLP